jgi:hypothetical protein
MEPQMDADARGFIPKTGVYSDKLHSIAKYETIFLQWCETVVNSWPDRNDS